jgi:hypothetical protein
MLLDEDAELADRIVAVGTNALETQTNGHRVKRPWPNQFLRWFRPWPLHVPTPEERNWVVLSIAVACHENGGSVPSKGGRV